MTDESNTNEQLVEDALNEGQTQDFNADVQSLDIIINSI